MNLIDAITRQVRENTWPDDAVYAVHYTVRCWPCGSDQRTQFFTDTAELAAWLKSHREWARLEDNHFSVDMAEEWDWGPQIRELRDILGETS